MSQSEPVYLFVYGTLMTRARGKLGADMRAKLRRAATSLGDATTPGRLIHLGTYPGLLGPRVPRDVVHGEIFKVERLDILAALDAYEGVSPEPEADDEYARTQAPVRLASGEEITAWVYVYRGPIAKFPTIFDGRWRS